MRTPREDERSLCLIRPSIVLRCTALRTDSDLGAEVGRDPGAELTNLFLDFIGRYQNLRYRVGHIKTR